MGSILTNGVFLPAEGERNCYEGLAANWTALDRLIGGYNVHISNTAIHVTAEDKQAWNGKADASALTAHTGNTAIHVTAEDKQAWNGKQDALSQTQLDAVNSGIDSTKVQQIATNTSDISSLQSGKANDSDVVHKSGNETIGGEKTFSDDITLQGTTTPVIKTISNIVQDTSAYNGSVSWVIRDKDNLNNILEYSLYKYSGKGIDWQLKLTGIHNGVSNTKGIRFTLDPVNNVSNFIPIGNNNAALGNFSTKWKDINTYLVNGVEPSSLSLPSGKVSDVINISGYLTYLDGTDNTYVAPSNGWITIDMNNCSGIHATITGFWGDSRVRASAGAIKFLMPVLKNQTVTLTIHGGTINNARFIPCQGNI